MKIIVLAGSKGGCGKTTLSFNIAIEATIRHSVFICDRDPQASLADLYDRREREMGEMNNPILIDGIHKLSEAVVEIQNKANRDLMIVDTPGSFMDIIEDAISVADCIAIPITTSPLDVRGQQAIFDVIDRYDKASKTVLIINKVDHRSKAHFEIFEAIKSKFPNKPIEISQRMAFVRATVIGHTGAEVDREAGAEITRMFSSLIKIMETEDAKNVDLKHRKDFIHRSQGSRKTRSKRRQTRRSRAPA